MARMRAPGRDLRRAPKSQVSDEAMQRCEVVTKCFSTRIGHFQPGSGAFADIALPDLDVARVFQHRYLLAQHRVAHLDCIPDDVKFRVIHMGESGHDAEPDGRVQLWVEFMPRMCRGGRAQRVPRIRPTITSGAAVRSEYGSHSHRERESVMSARAIPNPKRPALNANPME